MILDDLGIGTEQGYTEEIIERQLPETLRGEAAAITAAAVTLRAAMRKAIFAGHGKEFQEAFECYLRRQVARTVALRVEAAVRAAQRETETT